MSKPQKWQAFVVLALILGAAFRLAYPEDIVYLGDQQYMVDRMNNVGVTESWPWLGMQSGVRYKNPGMSVWIFLGLAKITGANDPVELARAVQLLNIAALILLAIFAFRWVSESERKLWIWAVALASVNSFAVMYHRVIWTQSVLPFFCVLIIMGWWKRSEKWGAFLLGFVGALIGQIHMSGFFLAPAIVGWIFLFHRKSMRWGSWFIGSALGALAMIPWVLEALHQTSSDPIPYHWSEVTQFRFWIFWITNPLGLHHGNAIGTYLGSSWKIQLGDYLRYPLIGENPTYLVAVAHILALSWGIVIYGKGLLALWKGRKEFRSILLERSTYTASMRTAVFLGYGILLTLTSVCIRRYYMIITFPFEWIFLAGVVYKVSPKRANYWLGTLFLLNIAMTLMFMNYIHVNEGATGGEYGPSYGRQIREGKSK